MLPVPPQVLRPAHLFKNQLRLYGPGAAALVSAVGLTALIPEALRRAVSMLDRSPAPEVVGAVAQMSLVIAALAIVQAIARIAARALFHTAARNVEQQARTAVLDQLLGLSPSFFRRTRTGDLISVLVNDLAGVRVMFGFGLLHLANAVCLLAAAAAMMARISPSLALASLAALPLGLLASRTLAQAVFRRARKLRDRLAALTTRVHEDIVGVGVVKTYALEHEREGAFRRANQEYAQESLRLAAAQGALAPLLGFIGGVGTLVVLWVGGAAVVAGRLHLADVVALNAYLLLMSSPLLMAGRLVAIFQRGMAAWSRLEEVLREQPTIVDGGVSAPDRFRGEIEVRGLTLAHDGRPVLQGVSFHAPPGTHLAIVGRSGAGKSTLLDAIARMAEIPAQTVFLDGLDVTTLPVAAVRRAVGYAPQEPFLFGTSIFENIAQGARLGVGAAQSVDERVHRAIGDASLTRDVSALRDGAQTVVGERGVILSGGQRQRVALARTLATGAPVLLLDDALSAVDVETEQEILRRIRGHGGTCIVVSHRVAAVREADQILVLDAGRIVEQGRHDDLLIKEGVYAELYRQQLLDTELDQSEQA